MGIVEKFIKEGQLTKEEYPELLHLYQDPDAVRLLREEAVRIQKKYFGNKIYTRGLIEFTNYCRNDCYYCGIRRSNRNASRYRLTKEEILQCCENGYELGFRTFVLQGGEDPWFNDDRMVDIIRSIKQGYLLVLQNKIIADINIRIIFVFRNGATAVDIYILYSMGLKIFYRGGNLCFRLIR